MKISVIVPNVGMTQDQMAERRRHLLRVCAPETEIVMVRNKEGPASIESEVEHEEAAVQIVRTMVGLKNQGFDAFIPWCGGDPGVAAGREMVQVPVIGPFQSSLAFAGMVGYRFSIMTPRTNPRLIRERVRALGQESRLASIRLLDIPVLRLRENLTKTLELMAEASQACLEDDGADTIILTCMGMFGLAEKLWDRVDVPIIDPGWAAVLMALGSVKMGITHSPLAYPFPKGES
jgi:allantoin racemase